MNARLSLAALALSALAAPAFAAGDADVGDKEFRKCKSCHAIESASDTIVKGGKTGPNLHGVIGRVAGTVEGFNYGADLVKLGETGFTWDEESLATYIEDPAAFLKDKLDDGAAKSKMSFKMRKNSADVAAYLATFSD